MGDVETKLKLLEAKLQSASSYAAKLGSEFSIELDFKINPPTDEIKSKRLPVEIPDLDLPSYVMEHFTDYGHRMALIDAYSGRSLSFKEFQNSVRAARNELHFRGMTAGDVLLLMAPNHIFYPIIYHATLSLGAVVSPCNPAFTVQEVLHQLRSCRASFACTTAQYLDTLKQANAQLADGVHTIVVLDDVPISTIFCKSLRAVLPFQSFLNLRPASLETGVTRQKQELALLPFSSGTSGVNKGIMLTNANVVANLQQITACVPLTTEDVLLACLPFFHMYGQTCIMNAGLRHGCTLVILSTFEPAHFLELIQRYRVTRLTVIPPLLNFLSKHSLVDEFDLSSLKTIVCGAAPLSARIAASCSQRLPHVDILQGYGLTELSPVCHLSEPGELDFNSVGSLLPNTSAKIVDPETGETVVLGQRGEICIKGPQVMLSYLGDPSPVVDEAGFLHTGDLGHINEDGSFFVSGRVSDFGNDASKTPSRTDPVALKNASLGFSDSE